jgi:hypothetical protein
MRAQFLLLSLARSSIATPSSSRGCHTFGHLYEGSEDATLWRAGLAFVSSGLLPSTTQPGLILLANLTGDLPSLQPVTILNLSLTFGFRPHGLHLDNVSQRLFAVSHSADLEEEAIFVFGVEGGDGPAMPVLRFRYVLTSTQFEYHGRPLLWFLNDVAAVDGSSELYTTQLGPLNTSSPQTFTKDKALWRCTWQETDLRPDGRLPASCTHAVPNLAYGLNGIAIHPNGSMLFVNDEFGGPQGASQILPYIRAADGKLSPLPQMSLDGNSIDNIERDRGSGGLMMGQYGSLHGRHEAALLSEMDGKGGYGPVQEGAALPSHEQFQVSTSLSYGRWTLLGSPWDLGPYVCEAVVE